MSAAAIRAGKAWVELGIRDKTGKHLDAILGRLNKWGTGLAAVGGVLTAAAGSILGALTAAAMQFNTMGSQALDMATSAAMGVEEFSALSYAAKQSGSSVEQLATGMNSLNRFTWQVVKGSKQATQVLDRLGISAADFLAATPDQRLGMVADGLLGVHDEGLKAGLAMAILGRSGSALLPMLSGGAKWLEALIDRARELGLVITKEEAEKAHRLGDAWDDVKMVWFAIAFQSGAALAGTLTTILNTTTEVGAAVVKFVRNNQALVVAVAAAAVVLGVVGGGLLALGAIMMGAGFAATLVATAIGGIVAVLGAVFSPLGLVVAILLGLGAALVFLVADWLMFSATGRIALAILTTALQAFWAFVSKVFGGMYDAIVAGNWGLAGDVLMAGLNVAVALGILQLQEQFSAFRAWVEKLFANIAVTAFDQMSGILIAMNAASVANGLGELPGIGLARASLGIARGAASAQGSSADARRKGDVTLAEAALAAAQLELDRAIAAAAAAREGAGPKSEERNKGMAAAIDDTASAFASGSLAGTFNAAIAGMLKDSAPAVSAAERTAAATERTAAATEVIADEVEGGFGVEVAE